MLALYKQREDGTPVAFMCAGTSYKRSNPRKPFAPMHKRGCQHHCNVVAAPACMVSGGSAYSSHKGLNTAMAIHIFGGQTRSSFGCII